MKKIIGLLSLACLFVVVSCSDKAPEVKKEIIVVKEQTPAAVIIVKEPTPPKSTTVTFDKKGVKIETKKDN